MASSEVVAVQETVDSSQDLPTTFSLLLDKFYVGACQKGWGIKCGFMMSCMNFEFIQTEIL